MKIKFKKIFLTLLCICSLSLLFTGCKDSEEAPKEQPKEEQTTEQNAEESQEMESEYEETELDDV